MRDALRVCETQRAVHAVDRSGMLKPSIGIC
jgi:hypothetical protein